MTGILIIVMLGYEVLKYLQYVAIPARCHILGFNALAGIALSHGNPVDYQSIKENKKVCIVILVP